MTLKDFFWMLSVLTLWENYRKSSSTVHEALALGNWGPKIKEIFFHPFITFSLPFSYVAKL